ncbi:MAG: hypothetical protein ABIR79_20325 [Candidatus Binatia bacterium]
MATRGTMIGAAAAALLFAASPALAAEPRTGMGPGAGTVEPRDDSPNPVGSPGRARTSIPGEMERPNAGSNAQKDATGGTESGNARVPAGPGGNAKASGPGSGVGAP